MLTEPWLAHYSKELHKLEVSELLKGLKPKGEWEDKMFRDVFQSNTSLMSDDEYEMIFGYPR